MLVALTYLLKLRRPGTELGEFRRSLKTFLFA